MNESQMRLAVIRSRRLHEFYSAERRIGVDPLTANQRMHEFARRLDARSPFDIEQEAVAKIMESST